MAILLMLFAATVQAKTAWFYDTDRSGEGIILSEIADGRLAFAFFSHTAFQRHGPTVSPAPPEPIYCDEYTVWFTGVTADYDGDVAYGFVHYDVAFPEFPEAVAAAVSESVVVGEFVIWREGDGFVLYMESNHLMCDLTVFGVEHYFTTKLTE